MWRHIPSLHPTHQSLFSKMTWEMEYLSSHRQVVLSFMWNKYTFLYIHIYLYIFNISTLCLLLLKSQQPRPRLIFCTKTTVCYQIRHLGLGRNLEFQLFINHAWGCSDKTKVVWASWQRNSSGFHIAPIRNRDDPQSRDQGLNLTENIKTLLIQIYRNQKVCPDSRVLNEWTHGPLCF